MKILVVLPRFPYPLEKGDKLRAYNQIRSLAERGHEIYLFAVDHNAVSQDSIRHLEAFCKEIVVVKLPRFDSYKNTLRNFFASKSIQMGYWDSKKSRKAIKAFIKKVEPDVLYSQMVRTMPLVARVNVPKVMDFQDALSMNMERRMNVHKKGFRHFVYHFEFKMLRSTEYNSFNIFDALTIISDIDSQAIPHKQNGEIHVVPNGVDFQYYKPLEREKKYEVVFCGNMQYEPNVNASVFLATQVMPLVREVIPNAKLLLAGATPKPAVRKLENEFVKVTGTVDDIRECYAQGTVFAAPMQIGSGLQNKLLEAMAMKIPCVTSTIANNSLCAEPDKEVLIGDTAQEFADHIIDLLQLEERRQQLAENGYQYVHQNFSWEHVGEQLEQILINASNIRI